VTFNFRLKPLANVSRLVIVNSTPKESLREEINVQRRPSHQHLDEAELRAKVVETCS